jgi:type 1 fimbria pilin
MPSFQLYVTINKYLMKKYIFSRNVHGLRAAFINTGASGETRTGLQRFNIYGFIARILCVVGFGTASCNAVAACNFINSQTAHVYTINVPAQSLSRDVPVGTVLYSSQLPAIPANASYANCNAPGNYVKTVSGSELVSSVNNAFTYATNIDGIGVRFYDGTPTGRGAYFGPGNSGSFAGQWGFGNNVFGAEIVRTKPTGVGPSSGTLTVAASGTFSLDGLLVATIQISTTEVSVQTCTVTTPSINVEMPRARASDLPAINSTSGDTNFNMGLTCAAGVKVAMTITDASDPGNTSTTLSLGHDSTASGIGYQIVNNSVAVAFGPDSASAGTANQFVIVPQSVSGTYSVPLSGRYIRTGKIQPGSANAYATFTMSYQ